MIRNNMHALMMLSATALIVLSLPVAYTMLRKNKPKARPQTQYSSSQFVFSAGAIPFVLDNGVPKKVVLVHNWKKDEWLLAKGRKDQGEELSATATREVLEETGYPCRLLSVPSLPTRATTPGLEHVPDVVRIAKDSTEPFAITVRRVGLAGDQVKLIFWYVGCVEVGQTTVTQQAPVGTHMAAEGFDKTGIFDIEDALTRLTFEGDRDLVRMAAELFKEDA